MSSITYKAMFDTLWSQISTYCWNIDTYKSIPSGYSRTYTTSTTQTGGTKEEPVPGHTLSMICTPPWPAVVTTSNAKSALASAFSTYYGSDISSDTTVRNAKEASIFISAACYALTRCVSLYLTYFTGDSGTRCVKYEPFFVSNTLSHSSSVPLKTMQEGDMGNTAYEQLNGWSMDKIISGMYYMVKSPNKAKLDYTTSWVCSSSSSSCSSTSSCCSSSCSCSSIFVAYFNI